MPSVIERRAASLFSTALFRPIAFGRSTDRADAAISRLRDDLALGATARNADVVQAAYAILCSTYRSEYFYKNLITSKIFIGRHRASNSVLLNEFRIGDSVADCVFVNGKGVVYEIKTEFDSPEKLASQIENYYRAFSLVNVVAHESTSERYLRAIGDTGVGLLTVGTRGRLTVLKQPEINELSLDIRTMVNTLRIAELTQILCEWHGHVPNVPNGIRYNEYLDLAKQIPTAVFQRLMQSALKARTLRNSRELLLEEKMTPLRSLILQLDPNTQQRTNLVNWLNSKEN